MAIGILLLRILFGAVVAAHGIRKTTHFLGGGGIGASANDFAASGFRGGRFTACLAGGTQVGSGVLLVFGFLTPLAALGAIGVMATATAVKFRSGYWSMKGGYEYPLVLTGLGVVLAWTGPGDYSLDALIGLTRWENALVSGVVTVVPLVLCCLVWLTLRAEPESDRLRATQSVTRGG
jgi:putative oxidoreductase